MQYVALDCSSCGSSNACGSHQRWRIRTDKKDERRNFRQVFGNLIRTGKRRRGRMTGSCRFPLLFSFLPISPARDGMPGWNIWNIMLAKKEKDIADARCFSLLLSGILAFVSVKFSVFVGFYHLSFSRPVSYRKRKKMPASWFQSRFSWNQENHVFPELCLFRQSGFA